MPRPACAMPAVIAVQARGFAAACGIVLAAALPQLLGDGLTAWPHWSRAALAQNVGAEASALQRLAGGLPYRPEEPGSGRLSEADLARAVDIIAGLEIFFATLAQSDADAQAGPVRRDSEAAYGAAATTLDTALRNGLFRIVVTEGSKFALVRRGDEVWVDSDLAGAWNMERVRRARQEGDDWPDVAALAALLFDHWRIRNAAGTAWMGLQLDRLDVSRAELERGGPVAAAVFTRYGFLKDVYFQAVLLATVTAGSENATLWDERAASIRQDIDTLLRSLATTGLGGDLPTKLRDGWAEYRARIEETSAERGNLVVTAREPDPALSRIGVVPRKPEQGPRPRIGREIAGEETAPQRTAPATETGLADEAEARQARPANPGARDQDYIALLLARAADAVRAAEDAKRQADALARQADAANLAAEEARIALATAQTGREGNAEETARLRQEAADLAGQLDRANSEQAALAAQLAESETARQAAEAAATEAAAARDAAESQLAELESRLTAAQSDAEGGAAETARLRQEAADLAGQLDRANGEQAALAAQLAETEDRASAAEAATAEAETARQGTEQRIAELETQLAAAQAEAESGAADTANLRQQAAGLTAQLADTRTRARAAEASAEAAAAEAGERIVALQERLAARDAALGRAEAQAANQASALTEAGAELGRLERQIAALQAAAAEDDSAKAALAATREATQGEAARADRAEAAAAASEEAASAARQDLANREVELENLRAELRALRQEDQASGQSATAETASPPSRASVWRTDWLAPVLAALLLAGGLAALLAVSRRRQPDRAPAGETSQSASNAPPATAPEPRPAPGAEPPVTPQPVRTPVEDAPAARPVPAAPVTSATIVEAVRRQDWASAEAQFSQLSGVPSPGLKDLLADPSGELLALACRAADLDRLTFAALYLLQGQGRAVADPEVVAGAVGLFEKTGPAEAQRRLAERRDNGSLSA